MIDIKVASRYAKSLLKIAIAENSLEDLYNDMVLVNDVCENNKDLTLLLQSPIIKTDKKTVIMNEIFGGKMSQIASSFIASWKSNGSNVQIPCSKHVSFFISSS